MKERSAGAFGHGKVILLGEHAVVFGTPAIAAGIARGVHARARVAERTSLAVAPWGVEVEPRSPRANGDRADDDDLGRALGAALETHPGRELPPLRVEADVELPGGAGLGCSAALGVAVIRAIDQAVGYEASDADVAERALSWERVFHGNPSGVDNTMAAHGGVAYYRKGEPLEPVRMSRPLKLVVGDSGEPSSTREMVAGVARQRERDPARFDKTLEAIASLVRNARLAIEAGDLYGLGQLMNLNHALLNSLMVSTSTLEEMCAAARDAGAEGAKLTGAGGGGCMFALVKDDDVAARVVRAIEDTGHRAFVAEAGR